MVQFTDLGQKPEAHRVSALFGWLLLEGVGMYLINRCHVTLPLDTGRYNGVLCCKLALMAVFMQTMSMFATDCQQPLLAVLYNPDDWQLSVLSYCVVVYIRRVSLSWNCAGLDAE